MAQGAGPPATPIPQLDGGYDPDHKAEQLRDTMRRLEAAETATANNYKAIYGAFLILQLTVVYCMQRWDPDQGIEYLSVAKR